MVRLAVDEEGDLLRRPLQRPGVEFAVVEVDAFGRELRGHRPVLAVLRVVQRPLGAARRVEAVDRVRGAVSLEDVYLAAVARVVGPQPEGGPDAARFVFNRG